MADRVGLGLLVVGGVAGPLLAFCARLWAPALAPATLLALFANLLLAARLMTRLQDDDFWRLAAAALAAGLVFLAQMFFGIFFVARAPVVVSEWLCISMNIMPLVFAVYASWRLELLTEDAAEK